MRFELNRSLTGMGHERFRSPAEASGHTPAAMLAQRLFASGQVDAVHVYSNIVTVELASGGKPDPLSEIVRTMYRYWQPGMKPPSLEELQPPAEEGGGGAAAGEGEAGGDTALSAAAQLVPAHLLERGRAARERWKAKTGG